MDEFSTFTVGSGVTFSEVPTVLKGIEDNVDSGDAHESDINRGLMQLLYSIPFDMRYKMLNSLNTTGDITYPSFVCPILLTTAKLYVLDKDFGVSFIKGKREISEIGKEVPFLKYYSEPPPTFHTHCSNIFSGLINTQQHSTFRVLSHLKYEN